MLSAVLADDVLDDSVCLSIQLLVDACPIYQRSRISRHQTSDSTHEVFSKMVSLNIRIIGRKRTLRRIVGIVRSTLTVAKIFVNLFFVMKNDHLDYVANSEESKSLDPFEKVVISTKFCRKFIYLSFCLFLCRS